MTSDERIRSVMKVAGEQTKLDIIEEDAKWLLLSEDERNELSRSYIEKLFSFDLEM